MQERLNLHLGVLTGLGNGNMELICRDFSTALESVASILSMDKNDLVTNLAGSNDIGSA